MIHERRTMAKTHLLKWRDPITGRISGAKLPLEKEVAENAAKKLNEFYPLHHHWAELVETKDTEQGTD